MLQTIQNLPNLFEALQALIAQIPPEHVTTCGTLADALGDRRAARWIGHYLLHHAHRAGCNCHRVVRAGGALGGFATGSEEAKRALLKAEGVVFDSPRVDLACYGFDDFVSMHPLRTLRQEQNSLTQQVNLAAWNKLPDRIGGIDVSYASSGKAVAAYTLVGTDSGELIWSTTVSHPVTFPYIPTYLTYRELPALLAAVSIARAADRFAELTLVDGTGILHPRRLGIATHFGIAAGAATVGITKRLLCGSVVGQPRPGTPVPIALDDRVTGVAVMPDENPRHTLYVSPGQGVDVPTAQQAVVQSLRGRRLPEPIYWADRLSRQAARDA